MLVPHKDKSSSDISMTARLVYFQQSYVIPRVNYIGTNHNRIEIINYI